MTLAECVKAQRSVCPSLTNWKTNPYAAAEEPSRSTGSRSTGALGLRACQTGRHKPPDLLIRKKR